MVVGAFYIYVGHGNSWRLHVMAHDAPMDQLTFRRNIARFYLRHFEQKKSHQSASVVPGLSHDGIGHYPIRIEKQLRCVICHSRVR